MEIDENIVKCSFDCTMVILAMFKDSSSRHDIMVDSSM